MGNVFGLGILVGGKWYGSVEFSGNESDVTVPSMAKILNARKIMNVSDFIAYGMRWMGATASCHMHRSHGADMLYVIRRARI